ncbi:MAG: DUF3592 domain-containing protein [Akkermansia sp.]|nr:DUF3592 domain-containing protein [Akkermansia sp.]
MTPLSNLLPFELSRHEKLLWSYAATSSSATHVKRKSLWVLAGVLLLLALAGYVAAACSSGDDPSYLAHLCLALGIILALTARQEYSRGRYETYALSNRRAFIIEHSARRKQEPVVLTFTVRPKMVYRTLRRNNGHMDYYLAEEYMGNDCMPRGFIDLPPEQDPGPVFEQLGVSLPAEGEKREASVIQRTKEAHSLSWRSILTIGVLVVGISFYLNDIYLYLAGQETTATIVSYEQGSRYRKRLIGCSRRIKVFYPVVSFTTADGQVCSAVSQNGYDKSPEHEPGTRIPLLYDPAKPENVTIKDDSLIFIPALMALVLAWYVRSLRRDWRSRKKEHESSRMLIKVN